jgi:hypothetical protein
MFSLFELAGKIRMQGIDFQWQAKFPSYYLSTITARDEQSLSLGRLMSGIYAHFYRVLYAY